MWGEALLTIIEVQEEEQRKKGMNLRMRIILESHNLIKTMKTLKWENECMECLILHYSLIRIMKDIS